MKDIDFDELDRAVNNSMKSGSGDSVLPVPNLHISNNVDNSEQKKDNSNVSRSMDGISPKPPIRTGGVTSTGPSLSVSRGMTLSLVDRRRATRFMDVVRPNVNLAPTKSLMGYSPSVSKLDLKPVESKIDQAKDNEIILSEQEIKPDYQKPAQPVKPDLVDEPKSQPQPEITSLPTFEEVNDVQSDDELPESPFLTDAKVEKRPLGAFSGGDKVVSRPDSSITVSDTREPLVDESGLPEELRSELLKIESMNAVDTKAKSTELNTQNTPKPMQEPSDNFISKLFSKTNEPKESQVQPKSQPAIVKKPTIPTPTSIKQPEPVTAQNSSGHRDDDQTVSIYDTTGYHKPLTGPVKKTTGWMWAIWLFVLLLIGAGAGALVYLLMF